MKTYLIVNTLASLAVPKEKFQTEIELSVVGRKGGEAYMVHGNFKIIFFLSFTKK